jgi:hypothetical protein
LSNNIYNCIKCELSIINEEKHDCPLEGAIQIGYVLINGNWYIEWVLIGNTSNGRYESKIIEPIPIPSYLRKDQLPSSPKNKHPDKTPDDSTEPIIIIKFNDLL